MEAAYDRREEEEEVTVTHNGKKRYLLSTGSFTRRKRAAQACQFCRLRKTKCDNVRPTCGFCIQHDARCVYDDDLQAAGAPPEDSRGGGVGAGGDQGPAYLAHLMNHLPRQREGDSEDASRQDLILRRLDEIKDMLRQTQESQEQAAQYRNPALGPGQAAAPQPSYTAGFSSHRGIANMASPGLNSVGQSPWAGGSDLDSFHNPVLVPLQNTSRRTSMAAIKAESLLKWPVFRSILPESILEIDSFLLEAEMDSISENAQDEDLTDRHVSSGPGIREDAFVPLCRKFLIHVHPRNPIIEAQTLMQYAREVEEHGLKWDSASCLVLLACAIAAFTEPWGKSRAHTRWDDLASIQFADAPNASSRPEADAYYLAARKRLGLLEFSILDTQCLFYASMYAKYCLQPLQAWFYIQQASARLQAHILRRQRQPSSSNISLQLEQRLFWSCFRAESELLMDVGLQSSGLGDFSYPDAFPAPPEDLYETASGTAEAPSTRPGGGDNTSSSSNNNNNDINNNSRSNNKLSYDPSWQARIVEQRSWSFYLAEISLRRTIDDTVQLLYARGEDYWMQHIAQVTHQCYDSEMQISIWHRHLPRIVQFTEEQSPDNEFAQLLQLRFLEWRENVLRPLLYIALHQDHSQPLAPETMQLATRALDVSAALLVHSATHFRHGGTWFIVRRPFTSACLILAVVLRPESGLRPPQDWTALVDLALRLLRYWGKEARDLRRMADVLEVIYTEACQRMPAHMTG